MSEVPLKDMFRKAAIERLPSTNLGILNPYTRDQLSFKEGSYFRLIDFGVTQL